METELPGSAPSRSGSLPKHNNDVSMRDYKSKSKSSKRLSSVSMADLTASERKRILDEEYKIYQEKQESNERHEQEKIYRELEKARLKYEQEKQELEKLRHEQELEEQRKEEKRKEALRKEILKIERERAELQAQAAAAGNQTVRLSQQSQNLIMRTGIPSLAEELNTNEIRTVMYNKSLQSLVLKDLDVTRCDKNCPKILDMINITKVLPKTSASDTVVFFGKWIAASPIAGNVSVKLSFRQVGDDNSLDIEVSAYKIINEILLRKYSPNFIALIAAFKCSNFQQELNQLSLQERYNFYLQLLQQIDEIPGIINGVADNRMNLNVLKQDLYNHRCRDKYMLKVRTNNKLINKQCNNTPVQPARWDLDCARFLVTEQATGVSLSKFLMDKLAHTPNTTNDIASLNNSLTSIIFQIIHACYVMFSMGLQHNDLHSGNVFIDPVDKSNPYTVIRLIYKVGDVIYSIPSNYIVKIYDFDFAFVRGQTNQKLNSQRSKDVGIYNELNSKFDLYIVFSTIYQQIMNSLTTEALVSKIILYHFIKEVCPLIKYRADYPFFGRFCKKRQNADVCIAPLYPDDSLMQTPLQMMRNKLFSKYVIYQSDIPPNYKYFFSF